MSTLAVRISDLATRIASEFKSIRTLINGNAADLSSLNTTSKSSLVSALNEVLALAAHADSAAGGAAVIDDSAASLLKTFSSSKITDMVNSAISQITNGAPAALDTLKELADALADDANFAANTTAAIGLRVRVDAPQGLTAAQKAQAKSNIDAYGSLEIGDPDTNYVTTFNAGLV